MKTKSLILTMMATLFTFGSATAQSHIDKIVEELEQKGVDVSKVVKRDPKTKKVVSETKNLSFYSKDGNYANRLKEAFKKDAEDAIEEAVNNHGNTILLFFKNGTKSAHYNLIITPNSGKDPSVRLNIIIRNGNNNGNDLPGWGARVIPLEGLEQFEFNEKDLEKLSDEEIKNFIKFQLQMGTSHSKIVTDLMKQGVKIEDIRRLRNHIDKRIQQKTDSVKQAKRAEATGKAKRS